MPISQPVMMLFALNQGIPAKLASRRFIAGNPENAIDLYSQRSPNLTGLHIDRGLFQNIDQYNCLSSKYPVFFVTRNSELAGMQQFFTLAIGEKMIQSHYSV